MTSEDIKIKNIIQKDLLNHIQKTSWKMCLWEGRLVQISAWCFSPYEQKVVNILYGFIKRPEDGMWLPTGGQIGNGHILVSSLAQGERCKQVRQLVVLLPVKSEVVYAAKLILLNPFQSSQYMFVY